MSKIKVIVKKVGKEPEVKFLDNTLKSYQEIVEGLIEIVSITKDIILICDEEGKLKELKNNLKLELDIIVGNILFCGWSNDEIISLTDNQIEFVKEFIKAHKA